MTNEQGAAHVAAGEFPLFTMTMIRPYAPKKRFRLPTFPQVLLMDAGKILGCLARSTGDLLDSVDFLSALARISWARRAATWSLSTLAHDTL